MKLFYHQEDDEDEDANDEASEDLRTLLLKKETLIYIWMKIKYVLWLKLLNGALILGMKE